MAPGFGIVNGYVMFKQCPKNQLRQIEKDFGKFLDVIVCEKGGMNGSLHKTFFLDKVFTRTAEILRKTWGKPNTILLCLDDLD